MKAQTGDVVRVTAPDSTFRGRCGLVVDEAESGTLSIALDSPAGYALSFGQCEVEVLDRPVSRIPVSEATARAGTAGKTLWTSGRIS